MNIDEPIESERFQLEARHLALDNSPPSKYQSRGKSSGKNFSPSLNDDPYGQLSHSPPQKYLQKNINMHIFD
jgi:hypothetical protein